MTARGAAAVPAHAQPDRTDADSQAPHPLLQRLFQELERQHLRWTLLRVPSDIAAPSGDVDVLVAPADADGLRRTAEELGFVSIPGWGSAPDLLLVHYERRSRRWILLDVATAVSFRSPRSWRLAGAAEQVLLHRRVRDHLATPAEGDLFWLVLLHCLLDKRFIAPHQRARLQRLAAAGAKSPLGPAVCSAAGSRFSPASFLATAESEDWELLTQLGRQLAAALKRRRSVRRHVRVLADDLLILARKPLLLPRRAGLSVALLGPNGVGKSTAAAHLQRSFPFESRVLYMGVWKHAGRTDGHAARIAELTIRPLRIWSRYLIALYHQLRGRLVIFDRYVYEARLPAKPPLLIAKRLYFWLLAHSVPPPRAVLVLDVPGAVAYRRKQENPPFELDAERRIYVELTARLPRAELIDARAGADGVCAEITAIVWRELSSRWRGASARR